MSPAQHEIDFRYDEALKTADNIMTFKLAVKTIAKRHGMFASFMPKPKYGINGSGMHVNMSLAKDGKNIFADPEGENGTQQRGILVYRWNHETYEGDDSDHQSAGQFLQETCSWI